MKRLLVLFSLIGILFGQYVHNSDVRIRGYLKVTDTYTQLDSVEASTITIGGITIPTSILYIDTSLVGFLNQDEDVTGEWTYSASFSFTNELDMTGANVWIDINPAGVGSKNIIDIVPTAVITTNAAEWKGINIDGSILDPSGDDITVIGMEIDFSGVSYSGANQYMEGIEIIMPFNSKAIDVEEGTFRMNTVIPNTAGAEFTGIDMIVDVTDMVSTTEYHAIDVATAGGSPSGMVVAVGTHSYVIPIHQHIESFTSPSQTEYAGRKTGGGSSWADGIDNIEIFFQNSDVVYIGNTVGAGQFNAIEVIMDTDGTKTVAPTFWYNTAADAWTQFTVGDDTDGFQHSGLIRWYLNGISALWTNDGDPGVGNSSTGYWIKIIRTANPDPGSPKPTTMKTGIATLYDWDASGNLSINSIAAIGKVSGATYGSDGSVTDAELLYINTLSSNAQDQIDLNNAKITTQWTTTGSDIYYNTGDVGIGTLTPLSKLSIDGGLHVGGDSDAGDNNLLVDGIISAPYLTISDSAFVDTLEVNVLDGEASDSSFYARKNGDWVSITEQHISDFSNPDYRLVHWKQDFINMRYLDGDAAKMLIIGDSFAPAYSRTFREDVFERFGYGGAYEIPNTDLGEAFYTFTSSFEYGWSYERDYTNTYNFSSRYITSSTPTDSFVITASRFNQIYILYDQFPGGGDFSVKIDGAPIDTIDTNGEASAKWYFHDFGDMTYTIDEPVTFELISDSCNIFGWNLRFDDYAGAVSDYAPIEINRIWQGGAHYEYFYNNDKGSSYVEELLDTLDVSLVIFSLLELNDDDAAAADSLIKIFKNASTNVDILLINPHATTTETYHTENHAKIYEEIARTNDIAFLNLQNYFGDIDDLSASGFVGDGLHLSPADGGYHLVGLALLEILFPSNLNDVGDLYANSIETRGIKINSKRTGLNTPPFSIWGTGATKSVLVDFASTLSGIANHSILGSFSDNIGGNYLSFDINSGGVHDQVEDVLVITGFGRVGIGELAPDSTLEVKGSVHITEHLRVEGDADFSGESWFADSTFRIRSGYIQTQSGSGFRLTSVSGSSTVPNIIPYRAELGTGISRSATNTLAIITNSTLAASFGPDGNANIIGGLHVGGTSGAGDNNLLVDGTVIIGSGLRHPILGYATGETVTRTVYLQIMDGANPGTNIDCNLTTNIYNAPTMANADDLAKSGTSGAWSLSANGTEITIDLTETVIAVTNVSIFREDLGNGDGAGYYIEGVQVGGNILLKLRARGNTTPLDWTTKTATSSDEILFNLTFYTST